MLKPLVIQHLLDSLCSSDVDLCPHLAMLTVADSGQIYASSRPKGKQQQQQRAVSLIHPRPKFKALMCSVREDTPLDEDEKSLVGALATRAWTEHKRALKKNDKTRNAFEGQDSKDVKLGLTLRNEVRQRSDLSLYSFDC